MINFFNVINTFFNDDVKKLLMMQELERRTVNLKRTRIGHMDHFTIYRFQDNY